MKRHSEDSTVELKVVGFFDGQYEDGSEQMVQAVTGSAFDGPEDLPCR